MPSSFQVIKQTESEWCWAAVGASIKNYFAPGTPLLRDCDVANTLFKTTDLCDPAAVSKGFDTPQFLQDVLEDLGNLKEVRPNAVLSFEEIQTEIAASSPICARISWFGEFGAHFVVIYGWGVSASGDRWLDIADPFYSNSTMLYESFVGNYQDAGEWTDTFLVQAEIRREQCRS